MKNTKLKALKLMTGIHTVFIRTKCIPKSIPKHLKGCVKNTELSLKSINGVEEYITIINPNRYGEIASINDYDRIMDSIMQDLGINSYQLTRIDFSLDNLEVGSYKKYLKIMMLTIMLIAMNHDTKSFYQSFNPLTLKAQTIRMDNEYFQVEYYDRSKKEGVAQARLELRTKRLIKTKRSILDEISLWCIRLKSLPNGVNKLEDMCNEILVGIWKEEYASGEVKGISEFIRKYQRNIFTDKQLADLCVLLGSTKKYAYGIKYDSKIETYNKSELKEFIDLIVEGLINITDDDHK